MWELGPRYPDLCFMRGVSKDHPISLSGSMRADRQSSLRGTLQVPSPSVASPTPRAPFYPLNIQVLWDNRILCLWWLWSKPPPFGAPARLPLEELIYGEAPLLLGTKRPSA